jgi:hypothetical protein
MSPGLSADLRTLVLDLGTAGRERPLTLRGHRLSSSTARLEDPLRLMGPVAAVRGETGAAQVRAVTSWLDPRPRARLHPPRGRTWPLWCIPSSTLPGTTACSSDSTVLGVPGPTRSASSWSSSVAGTPTTAGSEPSGAWSSPASPAGTRPSAGHRPPAQRRECWRLASPPATTASVTGIGTRPAHRAGARRDAARSPRERHLWRRGVSRARRAGLVRTLGVHDGAPAAAPGSMPLR